MEKAGLAVAQLTLAIAPHAKTIWIPCGPGNNGGDGFVAARILRSWGKNPVISCLADHPPNATDAAIALRRAIESGIEIRTDAPSQYEACIDALFGIGITREFDDKGARWIAQINQNRGPVIAVDVPTGLDADTGKAANQCVHANVTMSLLTLKPGLFTLNGRDVCGEIWYNSLDVDAREGSCAEINHPRHERTRLHNSHKGSFGDVAVVGGAPGMAGAVQLAASAALIAGAGRVFVVQLATGETPFAGSWPELMARDFAQLDYSKMTVVAGCGAGSDIGEKLRHLLQTSGKLVLDADALNAISTSYELKTLTCSRTAGSTVLTPHPLEAARLLGNETQAIQQDRLEAAQKLANYFRCVVLLKGSGSVIAAPGHLPRINPTGNGRLATPGAGDVLAGQIGALMGRGVDSFEAACQACFRHGQVADLWPEDIPLTAQSLARAL